MAFGGLPGDIRGNAMGSYPIKLHIPHPISLALSTIINVSTIICNAVETKAVQAPYTSSVASISTILYKSPFGINPWAGRL